MDYPFEFPLDIPRRGSRQRLAALHVQLRAAILDGRLKSGVRLPATRTLAEALALSRNTVVAAYDLLLGEGYIVARPGAGNFVAEVSVRHSPIRAPAADMRKQNRLAPYWRSFTQSPSPPPSVLANDFRLGIPDSRPFPYDIWRRLSARALRQVARQAPL
jgi:GntR family transcriptional regulator / MocR family aminotransferase